jgi:hypothetical protein
MAQSSYLVLHRFYRGNCEFCTKNIENYPRFDFCVPCAKYRKLLKNEGRGSKKFAPLLKKEILPMLSERTRHNQWGQICQQRDVDYSLHVKCKCNENSIYRIGAYTHCLRCGAPLEEQQ